MFISEADVKRVGIEVVLVNGTVMFKRRDRLYPSLDEAFFGSYSMECNTLNVENDMNPRCKGVPYKQDDNIFEKIHRGEILHAMVKF